ncbi:glycoside hydrolase family 97 protein [Paraglaciecola arctica]|uniref:Alpha-glucosidase n=1 Tax=Paraglaciecola arctica BSs20135 TaxID=493475 RepID=K6Y147_9ALTE|nr:alpha-glucosidase [Paraglaciecola arctica BSs20135]
MKLKHLANCGLLLTVFIVNQTMAKTVSLTSPNNALEIFLSDDNGAIKYQVKYAGKLVIQPSALGLLLKNEEGFSQNLSIRKSEILSADDTWVQPWGERKFVRDHHNELYVEFKEDDNSPFNIGIRFKLFDDGFGFRYEGLGDNKTPVAIIDDLTEFSFQQPEKIDSWWIPARGWNRYEYLYESTKLDKIDRVHTPFTFKLPGGEHVSIHEAALVNFAAMTLDQRRPGTLKSNLTPRYDGLKVLTTGDFKSSWRTVQIAKDAVGLLNSDLILNLNEPNKLGDVSWVKPGKYVGIWWGMHLNVNSWGSGPIHGATTQQTKQYMDFAAKYGFDGVLVEGWNIGWDGSWYENGDVFSFTQNYADFDLEAVTQYGKSKDVRLIGHHETSGSISNYENQMDDAYTLYQKHGVTQVKTGYVADGGQVKRIDENGIARMEWHDSQNVINHYLHSVKQAAKHQISINTHEPIKDTGLRRTYPNWISREGARGQEFNAWGSPPNSPAHTVNLVYTRMLAGPMDFTPGIFNLAYEGLDAENRVQTTLAKQLALYVVLYSPIQMAADLIEHYEQNLPAFQFIQDVSTDWQQSIALDGEVGEFVVFARQERDKNDWFLGAITNEKSREIKLALSFLEKGKSYQAQIYKDGEDADWKSNPYALDIVKQVVTSEDTLNLKLATSGGAAIRFKAL